MTIKEFAYSAHHFLQKSTEKTVKRTHVYELLAACFGYKSYAAFTVDAILTWQTSHRKNISIHVDNCFLNIYNL